MSIKVAVLQSGEQIIAGIIRAINIPTIPKESIRIKERIAPQKKCSSLSF